MIKILNIKTEINRPTDIDILVISVNKSQFIIYYLTKPSNKYVLRIEDV